jgi:hypothetical protein
VLITLPLSFIFRVVGMFGGATVARSWEPRRDKQRCVARKYPSSLCSLAFSSSVEGFLLMNRHVLGRVGYSDRIEGSSVRSPTYAVVTGPERRPRPRRQRSGAKERWTH